MTSIVRSGSLALRASACPTTSVMQRGFTLLELMIVVTIVGILGAIALPSYQAYVYRAKATEVVLVLDKLHTVLAAHQSEVGKIGAPNCIFYNEYIGGGGQGTLAPADGAAMVYRPYVTVNTFGSASATSTTAPVKEVAGMRKGELTVSKLGVRILPGSCIGNAMSVGQYTAMLIPLSGLSPSDRASAVQVIRAVQHIMQGQAVKATLSSTGVGKLYFQL